MTRVSQLSRVVGGVALLVLDSVPPEWGRGKIKIAGHERKAHLSFLLHFAVDKIIFNSYNLSPYGNYYSKFAEGSRADCPCV